MTTKHEAGRQSVMFNGGNPLRLEVSSEEVDKIEMILEEEVQMGLKDELDAVCFSQLRARRDAYLIQIAENYAVYVILEEDEEDTSSLLDKVVGGDSEASDVLEDAGVAAEFVAGGDKVEEELVEVSTYLYRSSRNLAKASLQDESNLFDWTVGVYIGPTPSPEEDGEVAFEPWSSSSSSEDFEEKDEIKSNSDMSDWDYS
jgi:hypothetical protein